MGEPCEYILCMREFTVPMRGRRPRAAEKPTFSIKIDTTYDEKIRQLRVANVDVPELLRQVIYEQIDQAAKQVFKKG